ncbi:glucosaminidase domain-containing protein [Autumnicola psychrophila]|uniref:Peptidoglycan hydrolase n=1 Tax=Autumnicola psychrophila TaxID=3075592 RepID=A0ABU3DWH0_9FLAO|nr:glucosaminidase domain-containing protein [Zunongwangia sp. F225]MDT0688076.1 glucosaminidase domain-containing protein [Zunongwangia sp. F225]
MKINRILLLFVLSIFIYSCGSRKKVPGKSGSEREVVVQGDAKRHIPEGTSAPMGHAESVEQYIAMFGPIAQEEMQLYKIPASITLAQGILESGAGKGRLSRNANNHFGIKCHGWNGDKIYHDDDARQECFRKYNHPKYSYRDHSLFLAERRRYAELFELDIDDYKGWARGLKRAGYATDRKYPNKLIDLIERYQLYRFDEEVLGKPSGTYADVSDERANTTYIVKKGDTLYSIAKRYSTTVAELQRSNDLDGTTISIGQLLYIN